jgi:glyoxylase-like metal-dependent hydrolase (beta-lactamase superfamily II)
MTMNPWFTIDTIDSSTYAISEYGHWEQVHSYLFLGRERAALIDTGLGIAPIEEVVHSLTGLPVDVITTHCHWDHIGGHRAFSGIAVHEADRAWMEFGIPVPLPVLRKQVMKEPFIVEPPVSFDIQNYVPFTGRPTRILHDGDLIHLGGRDLLVIHTPGHSPGHICLYEAQTGYLVTGDLIYAGTLYANYPSTDPVLFAQSVSRLAALPHITRLLPGHYRLDLPLDTLEKTHQAFRSLEAKGLLHQGAGIQVFDGFSILI